MIDDAPNAWETVGFAWECSCGEGSTEGILYDYDVIYSQAQSHAVRLPSHRVQLERKQARWVIPTPEAIASRNQAERRDT